MSGILAGLLGSFSANAADFELIQSTTLTSTATSISFTSIPQTYKHLRIIASVRSSASTSGTTGLRLDMRINGVATGYSSNFWSGTAGSASTTATYLNIGMVENDQTDGNTDIFGGSIAEINDYTSTGLKSISGVGLNMGATYVGYSMRGGGLSGNGGTSPITSLTFYGGDLKALDVGTKISIYGIRG